MMVGPMTEASDYRECIGALNFGKRVGLFLYVHLDGLDELPKPIRAFAAFASELAGKESFEFNIFKIGTKQTTISLLNYPGFWQQAFPLLSQSAKLDLDTHELRITNYQERDNQPVLHRKELLLPPGHPRYEGFSELTSQAEEIGLFKKPKSIGLSKGWKKALAEADVKVVGHTLKNRSSRQKKCTHEDDVQIDRHKSALTRHHLSVPLQCVEKYGYLNGDYTVFDYGCGKGDDLTSLADMEISAMGWDPHFRAEALKTSADIVNLGYVINVIEDRKERDAAVKESFDLCGKILVVSALIGNPDYVGAVREYSDGVVTSRGTFQKYYLPDELENYVRGLLNVPVLSVAHGIVLAFRNEEDADRFRAKRAGARKIGNRGSRERASELFLLDENARGVLSNFWERCVILGREPAVSELTETESLDALGLSPATAFRFLSKKLGTKAVEESGLLRTKELLIQFALGQFDGRVYFKYLSEDVQNDISVFFGGFKKLQAQSKELLFSIANTELLKSTCEEAASDGFGYLLTDDSLQLHVSLVECLPAVLQVYVGCALRLAGGIGRASLLKVHFQSGKVSLMTYDDFEGQAIPHLVERIKVNLWVRRTDYFDYIAGFAPPPLLMKSLFLSDEQEDFDEQAQFDQKVMKHGLFDIKNPHPTRRDFEAALEINRLHVRGFELIGYDQK